MNAAGNILNELLEISEVDVRSQRLLLLCGQDESLRQEVEGLLAAAEGMGGFLESPAIFGPEARDILFPELEGLDDVEGRTFLPIGALGEGGMGSVWLAQQTKPLERLVAIKLVKSGLKSQNVLARFEAERQILARLQHPNIATILDAGLLNRSRPFFVMEFVNGPPITQFAEAERLSIPERVRLMIAVCRAIEHAHSRGIIHRDIKPGNVLVTVVDGVALPKVIDFGIAQVLAVDEREDEGARTWQSMTGTPEYIAPELLGGDRGKIGQGTDVYALGVLLRELLESTSAQPRVLSQLRITAADQTATEELVADQAQARDGLTLHDTQLCSIMDLATHADPEVRYHTAKTLADVLTDYAAARTATVAPALGPRQVLLRRFLSLPVLLVSCVLAIVLWKLPGSSGDRFDSRLSGQGEVDMDTQAMRVKFEVPEGEIKAARERLTSLLVVLKVSGKGEYRASARELQAAADFWMQLEYLAGADPSQGLLKTEAIYATGVLDFVRGDLGVAAGRLVSAADELRKLKIGAKNPLEVNALLGETLRILSVVRYCQGAKQESRTLFGEKQSLSTTLTASGGKVPQLKVLDAVGLCRQLAEELSATGRVRNAIEEYEFASRQLAQIRGPERNSKDFLKALFMNSEGFSRALSDGDRKAEALSRALRACDLGAMLLNGGSPDSGMTLAVSDAFLLAGTLLADSGQLQEAVIWLQRSAEIGDQENVVAVGEQLSRIAVEMKVPEEGIRLLEESMAVFETLKFRRRQTVSKMAVRVQMLEQLADLLVGIGSNANAIAVLRQAAEVCDTVIAANGGGTIQYFAVQRAKSRYQIAAIRMKVGGDFRQRIREFEEAKKNYQELLREFPGDQVFTLSLARCHYQIGTCYLQNRDHEHGIEELSVAADMYELLLEKSPRDQVVRDEAASCLFLGGQSLIDEQKYSAGRQWLRRCTKMLVSELKLDPQNEKLSQMLTQVFYKLSIADSRERPLLQQP
ncbi:MAG: serine/threonine-protein kinase [Planctomycetia bacterium]